MRQTVENGSGTSDNTVYSVMELSRSAQGDFLLAPDAGEEGRIFFFLFPRHRSKAEVIEKYREL